MKNENTKKPVISWYYTNCSEIGRRIINLTEQYEITTKSNP